MQVEATWEDLRGSCIAVLRPKTCDQSSQEAEAAGEGVIEEGGIEEGDIEKDDTEEGDGSEEETEVGAGADASASGSGSEEGDERSSKEVSGPVRGVDWASIQLRRAGRRLEGQPGILRKPQRGVSRIFSALDLAAFTLLSAGATSLYSLDLPCILSLLPGSSFHSYLTPLLFLPFFLYFLDLPSILILLPCSSFHYFFTSWIFLPFVFTPRLPLPFFFTPWLFLTICFFTSWLFLPFFLYSLALPSSLSLLRCLLCGQQWRQCVLPPRGDRHHPHHP